LACPPPLLYNFILFFRKKYEVDNFKNAEFVDYSRQASESISIKGNFSFYTFIIDMFSQAQKPEKAVENDSSVKD
jgi:hypothetical protein